MKFSYRAELLQKKIDELILENLELKILAHNLQREIERHVLAEIHPMEDK